MRPRNAPVPYSTKPWLVSGGLAWCSKPSSAFTRTTSSPKRRIGSHTDDKKETVHVKKIAAMEKKYDAPPTGATARTRA